MEDHKEVQQVVEFTAYGDRLVIGRALESNGNDPMKVVNEYFELGDADFSTKYRWDDQVFAADREGNNQQQGASFHIEALDQPDYGLADTIEATPNAGLTTNTNDAYYERLALSRPPSRTGNHSPMDRVNEWNIVSGNANMNQEEDDLQKALRLSAQESGVALESQEYGVIDNISQSNLQITAPGATDNTSAPAPAIFGPARREDYNESSWAIVTRSAGTQWTQSRIDSILPSARQRIPGTPGLLVLADRNGQVSKADRLGGALTILHAIPLTRNIMLGGPQCTGYGNHPGWWKGEPIPRTLVPAVVPAVVVGVSETSSTTETGGVENASAASATTAVVPIGNSTDAMDAQTDTASQDDDVMDWEEYEDTSTSINEEIHRLVALLDQSERSFGTLNGLADAMGGTYILEYRFFEYLTGRDRVAAQPLQTLVRIDPISKNCAQVAPEDEDDDKQEICYIEVDVLAQNWPHINSLTDIWDNIMWQDTVGYSRPPSSARTMTVIEKQGDVIAVHINSESMKTAPTIPLTLSIERYMDSRRKEAIGLMDLIVHHRKELVDAQTRLTSLAMPINTAETRFNPDDPEMALTLMSVIECKNSISQYVGQKKYIQDRARFRVFAESGFDDVQFPQGAETTTGPDGMELPVSMTEEEAILVMKLESIIEQLELRKKALDTESSRLSRIATFHAKVLSQLSSVLTGTGADQPRMSELMYLRGIACDDGIVYLCRQELPTVESTIDEDEIIMNTPVDQWWRLALMPDSTPAVKAEKTTWERIAANMWSEGKNPLLIYATERALSAPPVDRPAALNQFLRFDNRHFQKEVDSVDLWGETTDGNDDVAMSEAPGDIWAGICGGVTDDQERGWGSPDSMSNGGGSHDEDLPGYEDIKREGQVQGGGERFRDSKEVVTEGVTVKEKILGISDEEGEADTDAGKEWKEDVGPPLPKRPE